MNNKSCLDNNHKYDLWSIDEVNNYAYRVCNKCKFKRTLPITDEIKKEVEMQNLASKLLKAFLMVSDDDANLLNYIDLIIDDYVNYLSKEDFRSLVKRVKELEENDIIDAKNVIFLNKLETYFVVNSNEEDDDNLFNLIINEDINITSYEES